MADYISREAAKQFICRSCAACFCRPEKCNTLMEFDRQVPAADVAPVVHAHWVWPETERDRPFCSNCLNDAFWDNDHGFVTENFCPNCGARMDKSEGEV